MREKVVLAYSGGLDTTAIVPRPKGNLDYEVICCCTDCGRGNELDGLDKGAKLSGAPELYMKNLVDDLYNNYIALHIQAGAICESKYLLGTFVVRPAIAERLVEITRKKDASAICHSVTGEGNDQIRFEPGIKALVPGIKIIASWHMTDIWTVQSCEDEIELYRQHGIDLPLSVDSSYSRGRNLWHANHEGLELEDPANEPNYDHLLVLGASPEKTPDKGGCVTVTFEKEIPVSANGKEIKVPGIITKLDVLGGKHSIDIVDIVGNHVVGMKSRSIYEAPGDTILVEAHTQLEESALGRATIEVKRDIGNKFARIAYEGEWFTPLHKTIQVFVESTQAYVIGKVKLKLYKGNIIKVGVTPSYSLYDESLAPLTTGDLYDHHNVDGLITLLGLPLKVRAMKMAELEKNNQK